MKTSPATVQSMTLPGIEDPHSRDPEVQAVVEAWLHADPALDQTAAIFRATFDQLYDGQHTGRFRWDQLFKTEKTHFGTLLEINLRRAFDPFISDGATLDYKIEGVEIDCKYSQTSGGWMIPPEAFGHLLLVAHAADTAGTWELGVVRATEENLGRGQNRDLKKSLSAAGRRNITWIARDAELPPNVLLSLDPYIVEDIMGSRSGQERINRLCRAVEGRRFGRNTVATVATQDDYMKRMRENGGARSILAREGYIIPSGDYSSHRRVAEGLGAEVPKPGEFVSLLVMETNLPGLGVVELDGRLWRRAPSPELATLPAPKLPSTKRERPDRPPATPAPS